MVYILDGSEKRASKGDKLRIPPMTSHTFWSDPESGQALDVTVTTGGGPNPGFDETFG
jgi:uncharacterized protein YfaP (DUF2135 family)